MLEFEKQIKSIDDRLRQLHNTLWTIVYVQNDYYGKGMTVCFESCKSERKTYQLEQNLRKHVEIRRSFL